MYINIIIGIVFIVLVVMVVKDFWNRLKSPAKIMEDELKQRREQQEQVAANIERLRETGLKNLIPVQQAITEMNDALPEAKQFAVDNSDTKILVVFEKTYLEISHQLTQFSLHGNEQDFSDDIAMHQSFIIEHKDEQGNVITRREADSEEEAIRIIAREIAVVIEP